MENEVKEVLAEEATNPTEGASRKSSKGAILGIVAVTTVALLLKFRGKIGTKIENAMAKRLGKKGYAILSPDEMEELPKAVTEIIE